MKLLFVILDKYRYGYHLHRFLGTASFPLPHPPKQRKSEGRQAQKKCNYEEGIENSCSSDSTSFNKDEHVLKKPEVEERKPDNEDKGGDSKEREDETSTDQDKRTCWCKRKIPVSVLEYLELKGDITMIEVIYIWGLMYQRLG